jgi:hypothetical protein
MKVCKRCGKEIEGSFGSGRYCSRACANSRVWTQEDRKKKSESARNSTRVKEANQARRGRKSATKNPTLRTRVCRRVDWVCPVCNTGMRLTPYEAKKRKYCSGSCRNKATNPAKNGSVSKAEKQLRKPFKTSWICWS